MGNSSPLAAWTFMICTAPLAVGAPRPRARRFLFQAGDGFQELADPDQTTGLGIGQQLGDVVAARARPTRSAAR